MIIDEIQRVPELLPILKMCSDEDNEKGRYLLKGSADVTALPDAFKHLKWFKDNIAGDKPFSGIILYTGTHYVSYAQDMHLVPMSALWE